MTLTKDDYSEYISIDALEIRDTDTHDGKECDYSIYKTKTIIVENGLDQDVDITCEAARDKEFTNPYPIGSATTVSANSNKYIECNVFVQFFRVNAKCTVSPTTGDLGVYIFRLKG